MTVLDDARALLATGPLCDSCLGRPLADRSHGLRNDERGRALGVAVALEDDDPFEPPDPAECWVCEGLCTRFDAFAERAAAELDGVELFTYLVGTRVPPLVEENEALLREDAGLSPEAGEALNTEFNREVGRRLGANLDATVEFERPDVQILLDLDLAGSAGQVEIDIHSLAIYGRYRKLERGIPQTEWEKFDTSVEELVAPPALSTFRGTGSVFHGAGREDVDARMLGTGRPFVLEIEEPRRRDADLEELSAEIDDHADGAVEVDGLRFATHDMIERVKELPASKVYRIRVRFDEVPEEAAFREALAELDGATLQQRTPNRVAHRRADCVRERTVYDLAGVLNDDDVDVDFDDIDVDFDDIDVDFDDIDVDFDDDGDDVDVEIDDFPEGDLDSILDDVPVVDVEEDLGGGADRAATGTLVVHGEGGLYVKELVTGDDGRTRPNLAGLLGVSAAVSALDVLAVRGEDEPFLHPAYLRDVRSEE